jgi:hypothetical protein
MKYRIMVTCQTIVVIKPLEEPGFSPLWHLKEGGFFAIKYFATPLGDQF